MASARASQRLYHRYERETPETMEVTTRLKPSEAIRRAHGDDGAPVPRPVPQIIELLDISANSCQADTSVSVDEPLFQPLPCEVVFTDFAPFESHTQTLYMRNNDRFNRNIRIVAPSSAAFTVTGPHPVKKSRRAKGQLCDGKVAPGMEVCFIVHFTSRECRDYCCDLVCVTDREKFIVPVTAVGPRPLLDVPDKVDFGNAPVNTTTERTIMLRNIGHAAATVSVAASGAFSATVRDAFVAAGSATQVTVSFLPDHVEDFDEQLLVSFQTIESDPSARTVDAGTLAARATLAHPFARSAAAAPPRKRLVLPELAVRLFGTSCNAEIVLSQSAVKFPATFISLASHLSLRVVNSSDIPVEFNWKSNATAEADEFARDALLRDVDDLEAMEFKALMAHDFSDGELLSGGAGASAFGSTSGPTSLAQQRELAAHKRKFENLRSAALTDPLSFADEAFVLEPLSGTIYPGTEVIIKGTFRPTMPSEHLCTAFLQVGGRDTRLPLQLLGKGLGPAASFSFDRLNLDDVYIFSKRRYEVEIVNRGSIAARWNAPVAEEGAWASKFVFEPKTDFLPIGGHCTVQVTFRSDELGDFDEQFPFKLVGCAEPMLLKVKGTVIGPSFRLDTQQLAFGNVAFGFKHKKKFRITNTCQIPVEFDVRCPEDEEACSAVGGAAATRREVTMTPAGGSVPPNGSMQVEVAIESKRIGVYDYSVAIDVRGLGAAAATLPLVAICAVPDVYLKVGAEELDFGDCFVRYSYTKPLTLVNHSDVAARWEVLPQDEHSKPLALLAPHAATNGHSGVIEAHSECDIMMELKCRRLGSAVLPVYISVSGNDGAPLLAICKAESIGPIVTVDQPELNWGRTPCLIPTTRDLVMKNESLIEARYRAMIVGKRSKWRIKDSKSGLATDGRLQPGESITISLVVTLDDILTFRDTLRIIVPEGEEVHVPLAAQGVGTTIYCSEDITAVPFSHQLTNRDCERRFLLENKGRRTQQLSWSNASLVEAIQAQRKALDVERRKPKKGGARKKDLADVPLPEAIFSVTPESVTLQPHTACFFTFKGKCDDVGAIAEQLVCEAKVGKDKNARPIFSTVVSADFINPLLEPSTSSLAFEFLWSAASEASEGARGVIEQPLTLTNTSALPLAFALHTKAPFSVTVGSEEITLPSGESFTATVAFDPHARGDRKSHVAKGRVSAVYRNHPQRDHIELIGESSFPNLELEHEVVDFETMVNDTTTTIGMRLTNPTKVPCAFDWSFLEGGGAHEVRRRRGGGDTSRSRADGTTRSRADDGDDVIPVNQVFDIVPGSGVVQPGDSIEVMLSMYAHANRVARATAMLEVQGGPEYEIGLKGSSSAVAWAITPENRVIQCGQIAFDQSVEREFHILNKGKVPFAFAISSKWLSRPGIVRVKPESGTVGANGKQRIVVVFRPGVPAPLSEILELQLAHFEPFNVTVNCEGTFASAALSLPATEPPNWDELVHEATGIRASAAPSSPAPSAPTAASEEAAVAPAEAEKLNAPPASPSATLRPGSSPFGTLGIGARLKSKQRARSAHPGMDLATFEINNEARRIYFMRHLEEQSSALALNPAFSLAAATPRTASPRNLRSAASKRGRSAASANKPPAFVIAEYIANFGNVVYGTTRKKVFRMTNTSPIPVTMHLDTKVLFRSGFTVEPESVSRLPPGQTQEFTVKFTAESKGKQSSGGTRGNKSRGKSAASKKSRGGGTSSSAKRQRSGLKIVTVPIVMRSGPQMVLSLKANITMPDLIMTPHHLDFSSVLVGQCRKMFFTVRNPTPVVTEWSVVKDPKMAADPRLQRVATKYVLEPVSGVLKSGESQTLCVTYTPTDAKAGTDDSCNIAIKCNSNPQIKSLALSGAPDVLSMAIEPSMLTLGPMLPSGERDSTTVTLKNTCNYPIEVFSLDFDEQYRQDEAVLRAAEGYGEENMLLLPEYVAGAGLPAHLTAEKETPAAEGAEAEASAEDEVAAAADSSAEAAGAVPAEAPVVEAAGFVDGKSLVAIVAAPQHGGGGEIAASLAEKYSLALISLEELLAAAASGDAVVEAKAEETVEAKEATALAALKERLQQQDCKRGFVLSSLSCSALASEASAASVLRAAIGATAPHVACLKFDAAALTHRVEVRKAELAARSRPSSAAQLEGFDAAAAAEMESTLAALATLIASAPVAAAAEESKEDSVEAEQSEAAAVDPLHSIAITAEEDFDAIFSRVLATLPPTFTVKKKTVDLPPSESYQLVKRPTERFARKVSQYFRIENVATPAAGNGGDAAPAEGAEAAGSRPASAAAGGAAATRWIIPAQGSVDVLVTFLPEAVGKFDQTLAFEIFMAPPMSASSSSLFCRGVCAVPSINPDPRNVFMRRTKSAPPARVCKKFVVSRNMFEFGPLLVGKDKTGRDADAMRTNGDCFRISNDGPFTAKVNFSFLEGRAGAASVAAGPTEGDEGAEAAAAAAPAAKSGKPSDVFVVEPAALELEPGETKELAVWAYPQAEGTVEATLRCTIEDSPEVVSFDCSCIGASAAVEIHGPWENAAAPAAAAPSAGEGAEGAEAAPAAAPASKAKGEAVVDFQRLLLGRQEQQQFTVHNASVIPVAWRLNLEGLKEIEEFTLTPESGILKAGQTATVSVAFTALTVKKLGGAGEGAVPAPKIAVEYCNAEQGFFDGEGADARGIVKALQMSLQAEAYKIDTVAIGHEAIDFGDMLVGRTSTKEFQLTNGGLYPVHFKVKFARAGLQSMFAMTPMDGMLAPGAEIAIAVRFTAPADRRTHLRNNKDIKVTLFDQRPGEAERLVDTHDVVVSVQTHFAEVRLQPLTGINFGAVSFCEMRKRKIAIKNDSLFPAYFAFATTRVGAEEAVDALQPRVAPAGGEGEEGAAAGAAPPQPSEPAEVGAGEPLVAGPFTVKPSQGRVPAGGSCVMTVEFAANGNRLDKEMIYVGVNDLDRRSFGMQAQRVDGKEDAGGSISFELTGESCIPGMVSSKDLGSLFEEQEVVHTLVPATRPAEHMTKQEKDAAERAVLALRQKRVFARSEKVFSFGCYVIDSGEERAEEKQPAEEEKRPSSRGRIAAEAAIPGARERFRITNPCKVPCTVRFELKSADGATSAFTVHPEKIDLPPHEHRFVSVYFKPMAMQEYRADFIANVEVVGEQTEPQSLPQSYAAARNLIFGLLGEGTLPSVVLKGAESGSLDFGRLRLGRKLSKTPVLRNDGPVVATVRLDLEMGRGFALKGRGSTLMLYPRDEIELPIQFNPIAAGACSAKLEISVLHNRFDKIVLPLSGESYIEDVTFEGLPDEAEDELRFDDQYFVGTASPEGAVEDLEAEGAAPADDAALAEEGAESIGGEAAVSVAAAPRVGATVSFELRNTADDTVRFEWGEHADFSFSPSIGHLEPRSVKRVEATFTYSSSGAAVAFEKEAVSLTTQRIVLAEPSRGAAWDTTKRAVSFGEGEDAGAAADDAVAEPAFEAVEGAEPKQLQLMCTARADWTTYTCSAARSVVFRDTFMSEPRALCPGDQHFIDGPRLQLVDGARVAFLYDHARRGRDPAGCDNDVQSALRADGRRVHALYGDVQHPTLEVGLRSACSRGERQRAPPDLPLRPPALHVPCIPPRGLHGAHRGGEKRRERRD